MPAVGARCDLRANRGRVKLVAADAVKSGFSTLPLKRAVIATIVPQPQSEEDERHQRAEDEGGGGELEHGDAKRCQILRISRRENCANVAAAVDAAHSDSR